MRFEDIEDNDQRQRTDLVNYKTSSHGYINMNTPKEWKWERMKQ